MKNEIITKKEIETQEELADALRNHGFQVTQATVSRDIKELRLVKALSADGAYRYVASDKKLIESLFETEKDKKEREIYFVPQDKNIPTKDFKRLKLVAKQIKKQKGGIKFLPLVACLVFVSVLVIAISLFKNPLLEKALVSSLQEVFKAKTDIEKVAGANFLRILGL